MENQIHSKQQAVVAMIETASKFYNGLGKHDKGYFKQTFLSKASRSDSFFILLMSNKILDPTISVIRALKFAYEDTQRKIDLEVAEMYLINDSAHELTA